MNKNFTFPNRNGQALAAQLSQPVGTIKAFALFAHCFTCSKDLRAVREIAKALSQENIAMLSFDFTGLGDSEGDFSDSNFSSSVEDVLDAAAYLSEHYQAPQILIGHSLGGAAALMAGNHIASLKTVISIAAPCKPEHVKHLLADKLEIIQSIGSATVQLAGRNFTIKQQFLDDINETVIHEHIEALGRQGKALLVMHAPSDDTVGIDNAAEIFRHAKHPKSFISLDNANHLLTKAVDAHYAARVLSAWASRYLEDSSSRTLPVAKAQAIIAHTGASYFTDIISPRHQLIADEPVELGGTDAGPTPFEYLRAALAACTSLTLRIYADRKKWSLEAVDTYVDIETITNEAGEKVAHFSIEIALHGDLDAEQRAKLLDISTRCPVHRTLKGKMAFNSTLRS